MPDKITVLYVEDNRENRLLVRRVLEAEQFTFLEADSASQAIQVLLDHLPDLILMDINLPEIDGYTLTTRLRSDPRLYGVPIIAMTANVMKGDRERTLQAGCDAYIQKPIDVDTLAAQLRRYV